MCEGFFIGFGVIRCLSLNRLPGPRRSRLFKHRLQLRCRRHPNLFMGDVQCKELAPQGDTQLLHFATDGLGRATVELAELRLTRSEEGRVGEECLCWG